MLARYEELDQAVKDKVVSIENQKRFSRQQSEEVDEDFSNNDRRGGVGQGGRGGNRGGRGGRRDNN